MLWSGSSRFLFVPPRGLGTYHRHYFWTGCGSCQFKIDCCWSKHVIRHLSCWVSVYSFRNWGNRAALPSFVEATAVIPSFYQWNCLITFSWPSPTLFPALWLCIPCNIHIPMCRPSSTMHQTFPSSCWSLTTSQPHTCPRATIFSCLTWANGLRSALSHQIMNSSFLRLP